MLVLGRNSPLCPSVRLFVCVCLRARVLECVRAYARAFVRACLCVHVCVCVCVCVRARARARSRVCVPHAYSQILLQQPPVPQLLKNVHHHVHNSPTLFPVHAKLTNFQVLQSLSLQHTQCCPVIYISVFQLDSCLEVSPPIFCTHFPSAEHLPHVQPSI